jgi:hypothetical protein
MNMKHRVRILVLGTVAALCLASVSQAQVAANTSQMDRMGALATHWKAQLGPRVNRLSGAAQSFIHLGEQWEKVKAMAATIAPARRGGLTVPPSSALSQAPRSKLAGQRESALVSPPNLSFTRFSGAVQSETSTAWCGRNAVVGFNDSGSLWETGGFFPTGGQSFEGYSVSTNGGRTFTNKGYPTVGPANTFTVGDPVLACTGPADFFYASLYEDYSVPGPSGFGFSDIALSISTDGGNSFGAPITAVAKDAYYYFLDKPWMTVDPSNPSNIFITYTDFDYEAFSGGTGNSCGAAGSDISRIAIELVTSVDGGSTWSSPTVVAEVCENASPPSFNSAFVQGSQVAVDQAGKVYVAWESVAPDFYTREIDIANSTDGGVTFSTPVKVSDVNAVGDGDLFYGLQGFIRDFEFPSLAIGKGKKNAGALYIAWNDGDNRVDDAWMQLIQSAFGVGDGKYGFSDIFFTSSTDGGTSWSAPTIINKRRGDHDNYEPGVAADSSGAIGVCWYDRRRDGNNFLIDRFCANSRNGVRWNNEKLTPRSYASVVNQDLMVASDYMGDYDQMTAQTTGGKKSGFLGGFVDTQKGFQTVIVKHF